MSYEAQFKGKLVWGTPVWRILLEPDTKRLKNEFKGKLTLFERRHEKEVVQFNSLQQFVDATRKMWKDSLRADSVQDTRLARWIEEYFSELRISATYQEILDAILGQFEDIPPLEVGEEEIMSQDTVSTLIPEVEDIMFSGSTRTIKGDFGDTEEVEKILQNFLEENKQVRSTEAKSSATFKLPDGREQSTDESRTIDENILADQVTINSGFNNTFGVPLTDIEFADVVPYDFKITDVNVGPGISEIGKEKTPEGLKFNWKIERLEAHENVELEYKLGKRMLRTILLRDDNTITILKSYENINHDKNSIWVETKYTFQSATTVIENIKLMDQLPGGLNLVSSNPEASPPIAHVRTSSQETQITWSYQNISNNTDFMVYYELDKYTRLLRDKAYLLDENDDPIAELVRIIKPTDKEGKFDVILGLRTRNEIPEHINIREILPQSVIVSIKEVEQGVIATLEEDNQKYVSWKFEKIPSDQSILAFLTYDTEEYLQFNKLEFYSTQQKINQEIRTEGVLKSDKIVLPTMSS